MLHLVCLHGKPNIHTCCIFVTSLHSVLSHNSSPGMLPQPTPFHRAPARKPLKSITWCYTWIFTQELHESSVNTVIESLMSPQTACMSIEQMHSYNLFDFFSVRFQMCPQDACIRGCKVTLIAFVSVFFTVYFFMSLQTASLRGGIVT